MPDEVMCPLCDFVNPATATRCLNCNISLSRAASSPPSPVPRPSVPVVLRPVVPLRTEHPVPPPPVRIDAPRWPISRLWTAIEVRMRHWVHVIGTWPATLRARWRRWADSDVKRDVVPYAVLLPLLTVLSLISPALLILGASLAAATSAWILDRRDLLAASILMPLCLGLAAIIT